MGCATLQQQPIRLTVSVGSLPEGFCPANLQELLQSFGDRLIVTPSQEFSAFAVGSSAPTSNIGPWFKNCEEWFVFDDATGTYIPIKKNGFDSHQFITVSGDFIVPQFIKRLRIHAWGGGGGGMQINAGGAAAGGGGGAYGCAIKTVTSGQVIPIVIGAGGAGGTSGAGSAGSDGTATTILGMSAGGGKGATGINTPGAGGTATGFDYAFRGGSGNGAANGVASGSARNGGSAPLGGAGGADSTDETEKAGKVPGGGGAGGFNFGALPTTGGGSGAAGGVLIQF